MKASAKSQQSWLKTRDALVGLKVKLEAKGIKIHLPLKEMSRWGGPRIKAFYCDLLNKHKKHLR